MALRYNRKFTDRQEIAIAKQYVKGASLSVLGEKHDVNIVTIRNVLKRCGIERRRRGNSSRGFNKTTVEKMLRLWRGGMSQHAIAQRYETHRDIINRVLRAHGYVSEKRHAQGKRHGMWKGGRTKTSNGYIAVLLKRDSPFLSMAISGAYVLEHRLIMAKHLGRPLTANETVHHINGDKTDNRFKNLELRNGKHGKGNVYVCGDCGSHNIIEKRLAS